MTMIRAVFVLFGMAEGAVHSGYLYDKLCVDRGVGIDGVDTRTEPEKHTVHCLLVSQCRSSGYGILTKPNGQSQYSMEVLLSDRGNADVINWLGTQEYSGSNVNVEISGSYDSQGRLHVDTIKRDGSLWNGSGAGASSESSTLMPSTTSEASSTSAKSTSSGTPSVTSGTLAGSAPPETSTSAALVTSAAGCAQVLATALIFLPLSLSRA